LRESDNLGETTMFADKIINF